MREKIPVGGWRHAEQRTVEVWAGKAKARDVVPGWPRGRSTSRHKRVEKAYPVPIPWSEFSLQQSLDQRERIFDYLVYRLEERRKADMMERWYGQQRIESRGSLYPQPMGERGLGPHGYYFGMDLGMGDAK